MPSERERVIKELWDRVLIKRCDIRAALAEAYDAGRKSGLEDAAKAAESCNGVMPTSNIAAAIRALKEKP